MSRPANPQDNLSAQLPDDLLDTVGRTVPLGSVVAAAAYDLDDHGMYADGYLVLTEEKLGYFARRNGRWKGAWVDTAALGEAKIVEGLGMNLLRLTADGVPVAEFRFTLRHARAVARLQRQLERMIGGNGDAEEAENEEYTPDEKKLRCDKCGRAIPSWSENCPACMSRRKILFRLLDFIKPYKVRAMAAFALALLLTGMAMVPAWLAKPLVNRGFGAGPGMDPDYGLVVWYVTIMGGLMVLRMIGQIAQLRLSLGLGTLVSRKIRNVIYAHMHRLSLSFFSKRQTGALVTRITSDTERLWYFISSTFIEMILAFLTLVGVWICLFTMNWKLAIFTLLPIPLMLSLTVFFHNRLHHFFRRMWHPLFDIEMAYISGVRSLFHPGMLLASSVGSLTVWLLGGWWVCRGQSDVGTLVSFQAFLAMFLRPIHQIAHMDEMLNRAATSAHRVFDILDTQHAIYSKTDSRRADIVEGHIELRNVSFSYDGIRKVLKNISTTIEPGQMVGLAGPSGGGKTTLVNLISRFYDTLEGQILIDGVDVRNYELTTLRRKIGVVLQEPFLFHGTVAENIAYGKPDATLDEIIVAAKAANAHEFIVGFPDGYDTMVGERGQTLSGGERQRISIARAILNDPVILILDEATSSVDTATEKLIQEALDRLTSNRTTIAIAHRLSTLRKADRLIILDKGNMVEEGSHGELSSKENGLYAKLLRMQEESQSVMGLGEA